MDSTVNNTDNKVKQNGSLKLILIALGGLLVLCAVATLCMASYTFFQNKAYEKKVETLRDKERKELGK